MKRIGFFLIVLSVLLSVFWGGANGQSSSMTTASSDLVFLHLGRSIDEQVGRFSNQKRVAYEKSLAKFPSFEDCLTSEVTQNLVPSSLKLDLERINTLQDVEVCVFWVSDYLKNPETIGQWLSHLGFDTNIEVFDLDHFMSGKSIVTGHWNRDFHKTKSPFHLTGMAKIETFFVNSGIRLDIEISKDGNVSQVNPSYSRGP